MTDEKRKQLKELYVDNRMGLVDILYDQYVTHNKEKVVKEGFFTPTQLEWIRNTYSILREADREMFNKKTE